VKILGISVDYAKWGSVKIVRSYESDAVMKGREGILVDWGFIM